MEYGYCRISKKTQNIERQIRNIRERYPDAYIFQEAFTGTKIYGRKEFDRLLGKVRSGDAIIFDSVSRMSRNAEEGFSLYETLFNQGVSLVFLKEPHINTDTYRQAVENVIHVRVDSGDVVTDDFIQSIMEALNKYMLELAKKQIRIAFEQAEKEVRDLHERTKEGIRTAKLNGKQIGVRSGAVLHIKKKAPIKEEIRKKSRDFSGSMTDKDLIKVLGIARNTYYKYKKELAEEVI